MFHTHIICTHLKRAHRALDDVINPLGWNENSRWVTTQCVTHARGTHVYLVRRVFGRFGGDKGAFTQTADGRHIHTSIYIYVCTYRNVSVNVACAVQQAQVPVLSHDAHSGDWRWDDGIHKNAFQKVDLRVEWGRSKSHRKPNTTRYTNYFNCSLSMFLRVCMQFDGYTLYSCIRFFVSEWHFVELSSKTTARLKLRL